MGAKGSVHASARLDCCQSARNARGGERISLEFRSEGFLESLRAILKDTRLDLRNLELELTESVPMQHAGSSVSVPGALKSIGVRLAVDDFGTGYSSLSY